MGNNGLSTILSAFRGGNSKISSARKKEYVLYAAGLLGGHNPGEGLEKTTEG
jgi:hypothetical protein